MKPFLKYILTCLLLKNDSLLTEGKNTGVNDIGEEEQHSGPDGWLTPEVCHDGDAPHQADRPVDNHTQAAKIHRSKPIPVAA